MHVAIIGRPNVGKSTLINRLLGYERSVVDAMPGTTRDPLDTPFKLQGEPCILIDTAGIRRKARIDDRIERFSVNRSLKRRRSRRSRHSRNRRPRRGHGSRRADSQLRFQRDKALIFAVNKWDIVSKATAMSKTYRDEVNYHLAFLEFVPVMFISAATGYGVRKMQETAASVFQVLPAQDFHVGRSTRHCSRSSELTRAPLSRRPSRKILSTALRPDRGRRHLTLFVNTPKGRDGKLPERY